ncbi:hypothetical protein WMW72_12305 [Paenibacillus filicis]|uniref:Hypervirulence associated protein TUDOR domain-containing protein n=1 Tax=Paenibacillus filicis TaxID=669464 RepID=A0ABU9DKS6_9BACL
MKPGDKVTWTSQSNGGVKTKTGVIHAVVPTGSRASIYLPKDISTSQRKFDNIFAVNFDRYIVAVPRGGKSVLTDYYCPKPGLLKLAGESGGSDT